MNIELIIIGNELLNGKITDKNTFWLSRFLASKCLCLYQVTIVQDYLPDILKALGDAFSRSQVVITSGGLGPTGDDLTKSALAAYFKKEMVHSDKAMEIVTRNYNNFEKIPHVKKNGYTQLPKDFEPIYNPKGYAPGLLYQFEDKKKMMMALPGVPREFESMFAAQLYPYIKNLLTVPDLKSSNITIRTRNLPEETIFFDLCPGLWEELCSFGVVSSLPKLLGVDIGIALSYSQQSEFEEMKNKVIEHINKTPLKNSIWQIGDDPIEKFILDKAESKKLSIACAESCTGGLLSSRLTDIPGSSKSFKGGIIAYSNEIKRDLLGVNEQTLKNNGAVSKNVACEMAIGVRQEFNTSIGIATTGIAGPDGGSIEKPIGTLAVAVSTLEQTRSYLFHFKGDREALKQKFTQMALYLCLENIS